ncbi:MAG: protoporphyrinogen oxidase, partial [Acidimicrobiales bacterium]
MSTRQSVIVVGAGISGLAAAHHLRQVAPEVNLTVVDAATRAGGMVETEHWRGLTIEHGPEGLLSTKPEALALIDQVGMTEDILTDGPAPRQTFIVRGGDLRPLPYGILNPTRTAAGNLLRSPLLSVRGKLRLAGEPFVRRRRDPEDESVCMFVRRRFGQEMVDALVDPLIGGIHGADTDRLSAQMLLPALHHIEQEGHSVALAALRRPGGKRSQRLPPLVTLRRGMGSLTDRLAEGLDGALQLGTRVETIEQVSAGWVVHFEGGAARTADALILAVPTGPAAELLRPHDSTLATALGDLPSSASQTVTLIWESGTVTAPSRGTGFLVPREEQRHLAACTWTTAKWHHRSEDGSVMVRCFMRVPAATDDELVSLARAELARLTDLAAVPARTIVRQVRAALPIIEVGHRARVTEIHRRVIQLGSLALAGAGLEGSGLPACVRSGTRAADA